MQFFQQGPIDIKGSICPLATPKDTATTNLGRKFIPTNAEWPLQKLVVETPAFSGCRTLWSPGRYTLQGCVCDAVGLGKSRTPRYRGKAAGQAVLVPLAQLCTASARARLRQLRSGAAQLHAAQEGLVPSTHAPTAAARRRRAVLTWLPEFLSPKTAEDEEWIAWSVFLRLWNTPQPYFFFNEVQWVNTHLFLLLQSITRYWDVILLLNVGSFEDRFKKPDYRTET